MSWTCFNKIQRQRTIWIVTASLRRIHSDSEISLTMFFSLLTTRWFSGQEVIMTAMVVWTLVRAGWVEMWSGWDSLLLHLTDWFVMRRKCQWWLMRTIRVQWWTESQLYISGYRSMDGGRWVSMAATLSSVSDWNCLLSLGVIPN